MERLKKLCDILTKLQNKIEVHNLEVEELKGNDDELNDNKANLIEEKRTIEEDYLYKYFKEKKLSISRFMVMFIISFLAVFSSLILIGAMIPAIFSMCFIIMPLAVYQHLEKIAFKLEDIDYLINKQNAKVDENKKLIELKHMEIDELNQLLNEARSYNISLDMTKIQNIENKLEIINEIDLFVKSLPKVKSKAIK